ncbi:unnamed protein product [Closterium sp. NIES-54]
MIRVCITKPSATNSSRRDSKIFCSGNEIFSGPPQIAAPLAELPPCPNCRAALLAVVPPLAALMLPFAARRAALGVVAVGVVAVGVELFRGEVLAVARGSNSSVRARPLRPSSFTCWKFHSQHRFFSRLDHAWRAEFGDEAERPRWAELHRSRVDIFALDYDALLAAMYALSICAEGDCYRCVSPDLCIEAAALGDSESALLGIAPAEALHTFTIDSGASRCFFCDSPVAPPFSCRLLSHQTLLWHHLLGHPSVPRLCGMHSGLLVSGLPRSLPPLPPSPAPPCLPCVEGRQRAAPHSSSFPSMTTPLQTLHMDVWGPARISGQGCERYFVLSVSSSASGSARTFDRGGEFSSDLLWDFCRGVARTSMIHAAAPHFLWPFVHQLNLWPRVSLPETSPTLRWTEKVGNASVFRDVTFDESVPFFCLLPYRTAPLPPPSPLFLAPSPPPVTVDSGAARGATSRGATSGGSEPASAEPGGAEPEGAESGGAESEGAESGGGEPRGTLSTGGPAAARAGGSTARDTGAGGAGAVCLGGAGVTAGAGGTRGAGAAGAGGVGGAGAGGPGAGAGGSGSGGAGAGDTGVGDSGVGGTGAGGAGAGGTSAGGTGAGGAGGTGAGGPGAVDPGAGGAGAGSATLLSPPPHQSQPQLQPDSPLPTSSSYTEQVDSLTERGEPESCPASPVRAVCTGRRVPRPRPPPIPGTHIMELRPSSVAMRSSAASALVAELVDFTAACRLDYTTTLVAESESDCPLSVGGECALCTDVLEDKQEDFECLATTIPHLVAMLLACEGDPDTPDIPTSRSCAEAITGLYSSQWQTAMDAEMASWKSTGTYVDAVPPSRANIVDGMWIFRVKRPPGSPPVFKARYVARGFSQQQGVAARRCLLPDLFPYPEEGWSSLVCTRRSGCAAHLASLGRFLQVLQGFGFRYSSPQSTPLPTRHSLLAPPSDDSVEPSGRYPALVGCLMYLMTCTRPDLPYPLSILARYFAPRRHQSEHWEAAKKVLRYLCSTSGMGLVLGGRGPIVLTGHADTSWVDDSATQRPSHGYTFSLGSSFVSWRFTHSTSVLTSICEAEIYARAMAAQELRWLTYLLTDLGERPLSPLVLYVDNKAMIALCQEHRVEHRTKHIALRFFLARELQQRGQLRLAYMATQANTADIFTKAHQSGDHQHFCIVLGLVPTLPHFLTA